MLGQISQLVFLCGEAGLRPFKQNVGDGRSVIRKVTLKRSVRELRILNRHHEPLCFLGTGCGDGKRPCVPWKRRSEEHTSELQSRLHLVCRLLLEKKKTTGCTACVSSCWRWPGDLAELLVPEPHLSLRSCRLFSPHAAMTGRCYSRPTSDQRLPHT